MHRGLTVGLLLAFLLVACGAPAASQQAAQKSDVHQLPLVTVYKSPT